VFCLLLLRRFSAWQAPAPAAALPSTGAVLPGIRRALTGMFGNLLLALRNRPLLRWIGLLQIADLLLDVFISYSALYFSDVVGLSATQTSLVLSGLMLSHLISNLALIPLLERVPGRKVVRTSAWLALLVYPAFLLAPWTWARSCWGSRPAFAPSAGTRCCKARLTRLRPAGLGQCWALSSLGSLVGGALIWLVGMVANRAGLQVAMWLLLLGPLGLVLFVPTPLASRPLLDYD